MSKILRVLMDSKGEKIITCTEEVRNDPLTLEEMQAIVGGLIDVVPLPDGRNMVVNDEGKLMDLPVNSLATKIWQEAYPTSQYPFNNAGDIRGSAIIFEADEEL